MQKKFLQAVCFHGKDYGLGIHEVPESVSKHPFFATMVKVGLIVDPEDSEKVVEKSAKEKAAYLVEKTEEAAAIKSEALQSLPEGAAPVEADEFGDEESEVADSEQKEQPSRKNKSKSKR